MLSNLNVQKLLIIALTGLLFLSCENEEETSNKELELTETSEITDDAGATYQVGYNQASSDNQNPYVKKTNASGEVIWEINHESSPVDGRATLITLGPDGAPWVVFTVDGGSNDGDYITQKHVQEGAFSNAIFRGYGRAGGAAKVTVIARLHPEDGRITQGTFMMARTSEGNIDAQDKTNTFVVDAIGVTDDKVAIKGRSWYLPPAEDANHSNFKFHPGAEANGNSPMTMEYTISAGLDQFLSAAFITEE